MSPAAPQRTERCTCDPAVARELIDHAFGGRLRLTSPGDGNWQVSLTQVDAGVICASDLGLAPYLTFDIEGRDQYIFTTVTEGVASFGDGRNDDRYQPGDVYLSITPHSDGVCRTRETRAHTIALPAELIDQTARADADQPATPVQFLSYRPDQDGARQWRDTSQFVDSVLASAEAAQPLLIGSVARLVAATALAIFANTAIIEPTIEDRHDAHPETVRRAIAFIEANADRDITLADIAVAAHVTARAVQLAFRRHLDTTPTAYLRRVRLDLAHRELQTTDPAEKTVTAVAYRWGFASPASSPATTAAATASPRTAPCATTDALRRPKCHPRLAR